MGLAYKAFVHALLPDYFTESSSEGVQTAFDIMKNAGCHASNIE
jgi:hypothetical protein